MPGFDLEELRALAAAVAADAGDFLLRGLGDERTTVETKSSLTDMVTEMDRAAEGRIAAALHAARPHDAMLGEEGTAAAGRSGVRWIVDPLDGTTNYLYRLPAFAVSLAAEVDGTVVVGAVHDPVHRETFTAVAGGGARMNEVPLTLPVDAGAGGLPTALIATGFAYSPARRAWQADLLVRILPAVRDIRRFGAATIDLCWVAAGRFDACYEHGLARWDYAAGALVAEEAGAWVGDLRGGEASSEITVAAAPALAADLVKLLRSAEADAAASAEEH